MNRYKKTEDTIWVGRKSDQNLYLHEKVTCIDLENETFKVGSLKKIGVLGYACDEGVKRNHGRTGAVKGPDDIRKMLAKLPNHLYDNTALLDVGTIECLDGDMENAQNQLAETVTQLLQKNVFPIVLGGGHDMAYGHYNGIKKHLNSKEENKSIGIINFDAHFDLRSNENGNNSGTPFYQISQDCKEAASHFNYLCLGIREDANTSVLFDTAKTFGVSYIERGRFNTHYLSSIAKEIRDFITSVDYIYVSIDLDGFSSAYAPGVSAASPMGFAPDIVLESLKLIIDSKKMISLDIAEMNPSYDIDNQTAKLAASLVHFVIHKL